MIDPPAPSPLFAPLRIGNVTVPNRIMQTAHSKQYSDRVESDRETAYFVRRARGGCGLFIAGNQFVHPTGSIRGFQDAFRPEAVDADRRMTDAIHDAGSKVFVQLNHHGAQASPDGPDGPRAVYAPSRILSPSTAHATREMSGPTRIVTIGDAFAPRTIDAAIFEAVELAYDIAGMATLRG